MTAQEFAELIPESRPNGGGWLAHCPAHDDRTRSLKIDAGDDGTVLIKCFADCEVEAIVAALGLTMADLFPASNTTSTGRGRGRQYPSTDTATPQPDPVGCTVAAYAAAKQLPLEKLNELGLSDVSYNRRPALRIPYRDVDGAVSAVRFRLALAKNAVGDDGRFAWRKGDKPILYGLNRLDVACGRREVTVVEGESDTHTLFCADIPALGLPGAATFKGEWAPLIAEIPIIYVVIEPDKGGETVLGWLGRSAIRDRVRLVRLPGFKDPSAMWMDNVAAFKDRWAEATRLAEPWAVYAERQAREQASTSWALCRPLAESPDILAELDKSLDRRGVVGERRLRRLVYLAVTSRTQPRPVSLAVTGTSSSGKSYVVQQVLEHCPQNAYYPLTAMSERALAYSDEPLEHRMMVIYEAAGLSGEFASYLIRSLLSEGHVRYETVEKTRDGMRARLINRAGPTGLITTTTAVHLHPENETRMLAISATDTRDQTHRILLALSQDRGQQPASDLESWHALQDWLSTGEHRVVVPFASQLADAIPPLATRLRRDFTTLLTLVRSHAVLHQATRARDAEGRIVATIRDYEAIYVLTKELFDIAVRATVSTTVRETVEAVRNLSGPSRVPVSATAVGEALSLDKGTVSRRLKMALSDGYIDNVEARKGRGMKLVVDEPLPESVVVLPSPASLNASCTVAELPEGSSSPSPVPPEVPLDGRF